VEAIMSPSVLKPPDRAFAIYLVAFFAAWTAYVFWLYPYVRAMGEGTLASAASGIAIRLVVWIAPVFLMLLHDDRVAPLRALKLVEGWKRGVLVGTLLSALLLVASLLRFGWPQDVGSRITWGSMLGPSFSVGFFEEIPFRGYILQKLSTRMNFWLGNVLTSLIFVGFHLPGWISLHLFAIPLVAIVFAISFILGAVFHYSRSLWSCIILHDANDFISFVLFHGR
jgi:CAAX protease family protein